MIVGTGIDLIDIRRIKKTLDKFGIRFIKRVFTDYEIKRSENKLKKTESYAKRFAAKEACSKLLVLALEEVFIGVILVLLIKILANPQLN